MITVELSKEQADALATLLATLEGQETDAVITSSQADQILLAVQLAVAREELAVAQDNYRRVANDSCSLRPALRKVSHALTAAQIRYDSLLQEEQKRTRQGSDWRITR